MKALILLPILFLAACGPSGSSNNTGDENIKTESFKCGNLQAEVLAISGTPKQEFVRSFARLIAERDSVCTLDQVTKYLDESLSIQCADDCTTKEK